MPRLLPLGADADEVWRELIADRRLTGRGATRIRRVARTLADLDDSAGITAAHLETRGGDAGRRAVSGPLGTALRASDPVEVAAATLASLPDMTHRRLRALVERGGGPVGALGGLERGSAPAVLCEGAPADELPARQSLARAWLAAARSDRTAARRWWRGDTRVYVAGTAGLPARRGAPRTARGAARRGRRARSALDRPRVAVVGTRAATPNGLADARDLGATLARAGVTVVSGLAIGIDGAVHEGALDAGGTRRRRRRPPGSTSCTRADTASLFERVRGSGLIVSELALRHPAAPVRLPRAQPDHRRAGRRSRWSSKPR